MSAEEMIHIPPDPHVLASYANVNLPWWQALAELVDNSLDAGAARIAIDVSGGRVLTVSDDGCGCEDITAMFQMGSHKKRKTSKKVLGRYGIGAKDAWLSCADTMEVVSNRKGVCSSMKVSYTDWMKNNWSVQKPTIFKTASPDGTKIILPLRSGKNMPDRKAFDSLAFSFTPAIRSGVQIVVVTGRVAKTTEPLKPFVMPLRNDVVQSEFDIDGKLVQIDIGILPDGVTIPRGPFWLIYGHRIIEETGVGVGNFSNRRLAGTITIGEGWSLTKNKDALSENTERLAEAIFCRIEHILRKADQLAETMESSALRCELQEMVNDAVSDSANKKEKRMKGNTKNSVAPKFTGRRRLNATVVQDGDGSVNAGPSRRMKKGSFILDWCEIEPESVGRFDRTGMRVALNLNNGFIAGAKADGNKTALVFCALSLIADHACRHDNKGNPLLNFSFGDFPQAIGMLAKDYMEAKQNAKSAV